MMPIMSYLQRPWRVRMVEPHAELYAQIGPEPSTADEYLGWMDSPTLAAHVVLLQEHYLERMAEE